jgi:hypothetical protein
MFESLTRTLEDNPVQFYAGMATADVDGDGQNECIVAAHGGRNLVLKWGGDAFYDVGLAPLTDDRSPSTGVCAADADGDGREEIYLASGEASPDRLLAWRGGWVDLFAAHRERLHSSQSVLAMDRFGMGRYGFLVAHEGGAFRYWELGANDRLEDRAALLGLARIAGGRSLIAAPLLEQGCHIYAGNEGITNMLLGPIGASRFEERAAIHGLADAKGMSRGLAVIDMNFDGRFELLCANRVGPHRLFVRGSQNQFVDAELESWSAASNARSIVVADFDNDGFEEIFVHNHGEANRLLAWRNQRWTSINCGSAEEPQSYGVGTLVGDWNGDGMLEMLLSHGETAPQSLTLHSAPSNRNHWIRIAPLTASGAPARGALVRLIDPENNQMRLIDCGSGYLCQMEPVAHFGLGARSTVTKIEVQWPDGSKAELHSPRVDQTHRVAYP